MRFDPTVSLGSIIVSATLIIYLVVNNWYFIKKFANLEDKIDSLIVRFNKSGI